MEYLIYVHPKRSILVAYHDEIAAIRAAGWPYRHIADWLKEHKQLAISPAAIRRYCVTRNISKPRKASGRSVAPPIAKPPEQTSQRFRCLEIDKPISIPRS